jgi:23S rRNA pseudouridine2605 synthase
MRLNKFIASNSTYSRREADDLILSQRVFVNNSVAIIGQQISESDKVTINGQFITKAKPVYLILHKPIDYVCSKNGQGTPTVYELLPSSLKGLKTVGRLDKDTSGLVLFTNDGEYAHTLTHPSFLKSKVYILKLNRTLKPEHRTQIEKGVSLDDGLSRLELIDDIDESKIIIKMHEGRNRQIRRTFEKLGYLVVSLHRTEFGPYRLNGLQSGQFKEVNKLS